MEKNNSDRRIAHSVSLSDARKSSSSGRSSGSVVSIFGIILIAIILINIPQFVDGNVEYKGFTDFFDIIKRAPVIDFDWIDEVFKELDKDLKLTVNNNFTGSPVTILDLSWLVTPVNWIINLFGGLAFLATGIIQIITYIVYFIPYIFGF